MENNHLTYFKVENFKKFDSLEVTDIGQFNLIVGDNNVGKTCLLEALLFDEEPSQLVCNFHLALQKRGLIFERKKITTEVNGKTITEIIAPKENYFIGNIIKNCKVNISTTFSYKKNNNLLMILPVSLILMDNNSIDSELNYKQGAVQKINENKFNNEYITSVRIKTVHNISVYYYFEGILNFPLVSFNDNAIENETLLIFESLKTKKEKGILLQALKVINSKIKDIEFRANFNDLKSVFLISYENQDEFVPLNYMGDGFKRIFYIVLKMISLRGKRIMIDEIEIGIHHSKMKDFWVNIFEVCKELKVQLFATTHSQECAEDYLNAVKKLHIEKSSRLITLRSERNNTVSFTKSITELESAIENDFNFRG
jgi:AAA15 family ATPase/GTPase